MSSRPDTSISYRRPRGRTRATAGRAVVGAGFTGLWAALQAKQRDPSADVAVLEEGPIGGQAPGRIAWLRTFDRFGLGFDSRRPPGARACRMLDWPTGV